MMKKPKFEGKGNILVVDKDPELRARVCMDLNGEGYTVFEASDGYQAFTLSENLAQPLHVLVAEVVVGADISGVELARHLRIMRPGLRVLYLSAIPANPALRLELQAALDSYLSKPFTGMDLVVKVDRLMAKRSLAGGRVAGMMEAGAAAGRKPEASSRRDWRPASSD